MARTKGSKNNTAYPKFTVGSLTNKSIVKSNPVPLSKYVASDNMHDAYIRAFRVRVFQTIQTWRQNLQMAEIQKVRWPIQKLYRDILLDSDIQAAIRYKTQQILSIDFELVDDNDEIIEEVNDNFHKSWFFNMLSNLIMAEFMGPVAFQIDAILEDGSINYTEIPREFYRPEDGLVSVSTSYGVIPNDKDAISIRSSEEYIDWNLEYLLDNPTNLGLLNILAPLYIYKKSCLQNWSQYQELFGQPMRVVHTEKEDPEERRMLHEMLIGMGSSASMVLDSKEREQIEFIANQNTDSYQVFNELMMFINNEYEKIILGSNNIMGNSNGKTGTYGASKNSSEEFHKFLSSSLRQITFWVNDVLIPHFYKLNIITDNCKFKFCDIDNLGPSDYVEIYSMLLQYYNVDKDEIKSRLGVTVEDKPLQQINQTNFNNNQNSGSTIKSKYNYLKK